MQNLPDNMTRGERLQALPLLAMESPIVSAALELSADDEELDAVAVRPHVCDGPVRCAQPDCSVCAGVLGQTLSGSEWALREGLNFHPAPSATYMDAVQMMREATDLDDESIVEELAGSDETLAGELMRAIDESEYRRGQDDTRRAQEAGPPGSAERDAAYLEMEREWAEEGDF